MSIEPEQLDRAAVQARRKEAGLPDIGDTWGLALSGGGVRSATFCFGLLRGLARAANLRRFDYLSTVSGGGYIGAALGRLYQPGNGAGEKETVAEHVENRLGSEDTLLLWWLRNNGRYLTPAGARDLAQALASILRNALFSQVEVAVLMLLAAGAMLLPYVVVVASGIGSGAWPGHGGWPIGEWDQFRSAWWLLCALPVLLSAHWIFAYWFGRESSAWRASGADWWAPGLSALIGGLIAASLVLHWFPGLSGKAVVAQWCIAALLFTPATARLWHSLAGQESTMASLRLGHTKRLGASLWLLGGFALTGALDWISAVLANWTLHGFRGPIIGTLTLAGVVTAVRAALPTIQRWLEKSPMQRVKPATLVNVVGLVLLLAVAVFWTTVFKVAVSPTVAWTWWPSAGMPNPSMVHWGFIVLVSAIFVLATAQDVEALNLSSLHNFYRARIERVYVSSGNWKREGRPEARFPERSALIEAKGNTSDVARLIEAVDGDDILLRNYAPHAYGGPIHLITCAVNQTVDDRTGQYNADRQGIALTVSSLGVETGTREPVPLGQLDLGTDPKDVGDRVDANVGKLSRWIAVSGAAVSSGMGSQTSPGLAALLFLTGLRLGYWSPKLLPARKPGAAQKEVTVTSVLRDWLARKFPKQSLLAAELFAQFPGLNSASWYVSDGGHFENTGVYPLLKRRLGLIVMADCGADPEYRFDDLENLVRKAKIDYGAGIEFLDPAQLAASGALPGSFLARIGTIASLDKNEGEACLLLARINYFGDGPPGLLVIVKPRRVKGLPLEVTGYAARNQDFPQQTTADQFFDEEQWEAYHQLGLFVGQWLTAQRLEELARAVRGPAAASISTVSNSQGG